MESFIYVKKNSICDDLCDEIINNFENEPKKHDGITIGGLQKHIKNTTDFIIPTNCEMWYKIHKCLLKELTKNIEQYIDSLCYDEYKMSSQNSKMDYTPLDKQNIIFFNSSEDNLIFSDFDILVIASFIVESDILGNIITNDLDKIASINLDK